MFYRLALALTVVLLNLGKADARIRMSFATARGYAEPWKVALLATPGSAAGNTVTDAMVDAVIPPGGTFSMETSGGPAILVRGYARLQVFNGIAVGGTARITRKVDGQVVHSFAVPLAPEAERRSSLPLRLDETAGLGTELVFVSETSDRHRGGGHPPTPATPPCVRVRTRRFESVTPTLLRSMTEVRAI